MEGEVFPERRGKRTFLAEMISKMGIDRVLRGIHDRGRRGLTVLGYHRVAPMRSPLNYPLDPRLVSATPEIFDQQISHLRDTCNVVSLEDVQLALRGDAELPTNAVAITFDDGFADFHRHAFPILRQYDLPATVFLPTSIIDSGELYWFEVVADLMRVAAPRSLTIEGCSGSWPHGDSLKARRASTWRVQQQLKTKSAQDLDSAMTALREARSGMAVCARTAELGRPLNWDEIKELSTAGIQFGSHTLSHPNLATIDAASLDRELGHSRRRIEEQIGQRVTAVAYPFGTADAFDTRVLDAAQQAGYTLGFSYLQGANWFPRMEPLALRRVGVSLHTSPAAFRTLVSLPDWFDHI